MVFAAWIDSQKAFDKLWTDGLLVNIQMNGVTSNMLSWLKYFLHNRKARVVIDNHYSRKVITRHGVPQGEVVSPTLFLIFIKDLIPELPKRIKAALYADDLVMWCTEKYSTTAAYRLHMAIDKLAAGQKIGASRSIRRSHLRPFLPKQKPRTVKLGETPLKNDDEPAPSETSESFFNCDLQQ